MGWVSPAYEMAGGSKGGGGVPNAQIQKGELANQTALTQIATQSAQQGNQLFNLAFPGMVTAENQAATLASGDPYAIAKLISPAAHQVNQATAGAKENIMRNAPAGGEKNLALENADVAQGGQIGALATQGYNSAFNSLAELGGRGINLGQGSTGTAVSSYGQSGSILNNLFNQNVEQKGATMGAFGQAAGTAAQLAAFAFA